MGARNDAAAELLKELPAVHELAARLDAPHPLAVAAARRAIDESREALLAGAAELPDPYARARQLAVELAHPSLRRVVNATGIIIHTNLGRAPLAPAARQALRAAAEGYSNLELELEDGRRGSRHAHVEGLLCELTGADAAIAVNNGAAAVLMATAALAGPGRAVVVSRGQLVEIGGGFRIPEVIAASGARLVEVGTTNRTRRRDYERALASAEVPVGAILRVHQSNFRAVGFVEEVEIEALCQLGVPVIDDVGSGVLWGSVGMPGLADEPAVRRSLAAGAAVVCCSADKLLGGPQAGLLMGSRGAIAAAREHPLARAARIDKLSLAALEATLRLYRDPELARREIPVLAMLGATDDELVLRTQRLHELIGTERAEVVTSTARVGGGALPLLELDGPAVALISDTAPMELAASLRRSDPPVIGRIHDGRVLLDPRTLTDAEVDVVAAAARTALS